MRHAGGTVRIDPASSGGWKRSARATVEEALERPGIHAITAPHTWLLGEGWKKAGPLLDPAATPG